MRPNESGRLPAHSRLDGVPQRDDPLLAPGDQQLASGRLPAHSRLDGVPQRDDPLLAPGDQQLAPGRLPAHAQPRTVPQQDDPLLAPWRQQLADLADPCPPAPVAQADPLDLPPPLPPTLAASVLAEPGSRLRPEREDDTVPLALVPFRRDEEAAAELAAYPLETPPRGLRKFDLGTVPASVTPPRSWRKAAWFAVGTSAAVVCALAIAAGRLVGGPSEVNEIDALPAYPTRPLDIERLPAQETTGNEPASTESSDGPDRTHHLPGREEEAALAGASAEPSAPDTWEVPYVDADEDPAATEPTTSVPMPTSPNRTTIGPMPVTPTDPQAMGDRTERYFELVTEDPRAARELCTSGVATESIEERYAGVDRVEVQEITIDRNQAITTSKVKVVRADGTETIEERRLSFTWGSDPKISEETTH